MNPPPYQLSSAPRSRPVPDLNLEATEEPMETAPPAAALPPHPPPHQLGSAASWTPGLDLNVEAMEAPMEMAPPAEALPPLPAKKRRAPAYTVNEIFQEFTYRRVALIRAITIDEAELFRKCNPGLESMYLYGNTDGSWEVREPELFLPPGLPEPTLGINKVRDMMERVKWLKQIAKHCDSWLISVAFFMAAKLLKANGRARLFTAINSLRSVHEAFLESETYRRLRREDKMKSVAAVEDLEAEDEEVDVEEVEDKEVDDEDDSFCEFCGSRYHANGFWIACDVCMGWFHGRCVKVKEDQADHIKHYVCPDCCLDKSGHDY